MDIPLKQGEVVGDYVVEEIIGVGGMAVVARAAHRSYRHKVAIKLLLPQAGRSAEVVKRFEREQRTLLQLHSEHTVRIFAAGKHGKLPYMILELLEGIDLAELIKSRGPLDAERAVGAMLQACHAIAEAHSLGIVHRDLKPGNLFLTRRHDGSPCVKVLDFGISKVSQSGPGGHEATLTRTRVVMGSPFYMSPEQMLSSRDADRRSDIWALGVTMYELLSKSLPFAAETTEAVCQRILQDEPTPLRKILPMIPGGLEATIMRCLQRKPSARFDNIADFAQRLADFGPEHSRFALEAIYELVPPNERDPSLALPAAEPAVVRETPGTDNTTLYLKPEESSGGVAGWLTLIVGVVAFAIGAGLSWVMTLDTDPTRGRGPVAPPPASVSEAPPAQDPTAAALPSATAEPAKPPRTPINLDEPPATALPPAGPPPATSFPPRTTPTAPAAPPVPSSTATATATVTATAPAPPAPSNVTF